MYTNHNISLYQLQDMIKENFTKQFEYLPETFNKEQQYALEIFKKRFYLEKIIDETISFNKNLTFENFKHTKLVSTAEELIEVFKLRSDIYSSLNYGSEFPDIIEGLNFDELDTKSAIAYCKNNNIVTGTIRLIIDSKDNLPTSKKIKDKFNFNYNSMSEISRIIVRNSQEGLCLEFKYLMKALYKIFIDNNIDIAISVIKKDHLKLYQKLGGVEVIDEVEGYGTLKSTFLIISYDPKSASKFFKKVFLEEKI